MWAAVGLGFCAIVHVGFAIKSMSDCFTQSHQDKQKMKQKDCEPSVTRHGVLRLCTFCEENVNTCNGYEMPCKHAIHYTCVMFLKQQFGNYFNSNMACKKCITRGSKNRQGESNKELKNRISKSQKCAVCETAITETPWTLPCRHDVHVKCWARMEETSTTCPRCMEDI